jgi:Flp pilus assembly protein TadD
MADVAPELLKKFNLAFKHFAKGELDVATTAFQALIAESPDFGMAYQALSEIHGRKGELDLAIASIRKAIELEPGEALYHTSLSRFLQRLGKIPEAEAASAAASQLKGRSI